VTIASLTAGQNALQSTSPKRVQLSTVYTNVFINASWFYLWNWRLKFK